MSPPVKNATINPMQRKWLEIAVIGFSAGVLLRSFVAVSVSALLLGIIVAAVFVLAAMFSRPNLKKWFVLSSFFLVAAVGGVARYEMSEPGGNALAVFKDQFMFAEGVVVAEPDVRDALTFLTVSLDKVKGKNEPIGVSEKIRVATDRFPEYSYGDRIQLSGKLVEPENFETEQGDMFDYRSYLAKDGIYFEMFRPKIILLERDQGNPAIATLLKFKFAFLSATNRMISEPENGLLSGIILGVKHGIPDSLTESFRRSGLVHIVVLSGYNLTIVAYALMQFFGWFGKYLPRVVSPLAGIVGILAFTVMAGGSATAVRAAIMALLVVLAGLVGRRYHITRALAVAAFAMIMYNPKILAFDPSFQLSFLATLGLIYLSPFFERRLGWITPKFGIRGIVTATLATQVFVLPRLVALSGTVSFVGVLANIIVLPFIPYTMLLGALSGFGAFVSEFVAIPFAYATYLLLHGVVRAAEFFASLPLASVSVPYIPAFVLALAYVPLVWFILKRQKLIDSAQ